MNEPAVTTRFAPSPTGLMHLGNLRTALFNALYAWHRGGRFLLRIEDTDQARSDFDYLEALLRDLQWLGLNWQQGPGCEQPAGGAFQAQRREIYDDYLSRLATAGHAYPCFCSEEELARVRREQQAAGRPPRYPGTCARLTPEQAQERFERGETASLRFRVPAGRELVWSDLVRGEQRFRSDDLGDFVLRRTDGSAAFLFCNALDDALMGVTDALRGEDHSANTPRQRLVLEALELPAPRYGHIALIVGSDGAPLSKRHGSRSVAELRDAGYLPEALCNYLARLGHRYESDELLDMDALARGFAVQRLGRSPARFDPEQLRHWQAVAVAAAPVSTLIDWLGDAELPAGQAEAFVELLRPNVRFPAELQAWVERVYGELEWSEEARQEFAEAGEGFFAEAAAVYREHGTDWASFSQALKAQTGRKGRGLFLPLRLALTGVTHGPELAGLLALLPAERVHERLSRAQTIAGAAV